VSIGGELQVLHHEFDCRSVEVPGEYMPNAGLLLGLCPQRSSISVEIGINNAAESSYSGLRIPDPLPSVTAFAGRVPAPLNGLFENFRVPPSLGKGEVVPNVEPASLTLCVTNIKRPKPPASADAHPQAGQEPVTQFDYLPIAWTHCVQSFRGQRLNMPRHEALQKVPKRFQTM
jgi:hypothetical protein